MKIPEHNPEGYDNQRNFAHYGSDRRADYYDVFLNPDREKEERNPFTEDNNLDKFHKDSIETNNLDKYHKDSQ